ncbi:MAG: 3-dehydroquinate synthase [Pseudomonadota bacterium]
MQSIEIRGTTGGSKILIGESFKNLGAYVGTRRSIIITDSNILHCYHKDFSPYEIIETGSGESIKNLRTVEHIYHKLIECNADRSSFIIGVGGGVVCDITGFVASTFLRGIDFGFVPTTLLSQVDASIGGKNGVNIDGYKNLVGVFNQPEFVLCDISFLNTLFADEVLNGLAEIVKCAVVGDARLFNFLEHNYHEVLNLDRKIMERLVFDAVAFKASIVNNDEKDNNERIKLNFGHTFGHAIEKTEGIPHGRAVSIGMAIATKLSVMRNLLEPSAANRIETLLLSLGLPIEFNSDKDQIKDAIRKDKKHRGNSIAVVLLKGLGEAVIEEISITDMEAVIDDMR